MERGLVLKWQILLALSILVVGVAIYIGSPLLRRHALLANSQIFEHQSGFSLRYPETWTFIDQKQLFLRNEKFVVGFHRLQRDDVALGVIIEPVAGKLFDKQIFIEQLKSDLSSLSNFREIGERETTVSGNLAIEYEYVFKPENRLTVKQRQMIVITDEEIFYISGSTSLEDPRAYWEEIDFMFDTFELK